MQDLPIPSEEVRISEPLSFQRLTASDLETAARELSSLDPSAGHGAAVGAYWRWRYVENPMRGATVIVARRGRRAVGKLSNVHTQISVDGVRVRAGLSEGLFVQPGERNWLCLRGLLECSLRECVSDCIAFGFAFVNPLAAELNRQAGWQDLGRLPIYSAFLNLTRTLAGRGVPCARLVGVAGQRLLGPSRRRSASGLVLREVAQFGPAFDELWHEIERRGGASVVKDAAYLEWRYRGHPARPYDCIAAWNGSRLEGVVVFRSGGPHADAYILELLTRDESPETIKPLVEAALAQLRTANVGLVSASFPPTSAAAHVLRRLGFVTWATNSWAMNLFVTTEKRVAALGSERWSLSLGDWLHH